MSLSLVTAPDVEPLTLDETKLHLRVDGDDEDTLITGLIQAARMQAETITSRAFITQTWDLFLDAFPCGSNEVLEIPLGQLQSVEYVKYLDTLGVQQTWASGNYQVDNATEPARLLPVYGVYYPWTSPATLNAVNVRFTCGYGDADNDVPQPIRQAMLLMIGSWYENRESTQVIPDVARLLLGSYKTRFA